MPFQSCAVLCLEAWLTLGAFDSRSGGQTSRCWGSSLARSQSAAIWCCTSTSRRSGNRGRCSVSVYLFLFLFLFLFRVDQFVSCFAGYPTETRGSLSMLRTIHRCLSLGFPLEVLCSRRCTIYGWMCSRQCARAASETVRQRKIPPTQSPNRRRHRATMRSNSAQPPR